MLAAFFAALLLEMAFRLIVFPDFRALDPEIFTRHPVFGHYTKPNLEVRRLNPGNWDVVNRTDELGMRVTGLPSGEALAGIWVAGDSNTYGGYVEDRETYASRLVRMGYPAANLASEGHSLVQQARMIRYLLAEGYRPKAIILSLSMYQTLGIYDDHLASLDLRPAPGEGTAIETREESGAAAFAKAMDTLWGRLTHDVTPVNIRSRLIRNSAVAAWLKAGIMGIPTLRDLTLKLGWRADLDLVVGGTLDTLRPIGEDPNAVPEIASTRRFLVSLAERIRQNAGVPFGVVLLPAHNQLRPAGFAKFLAANNLEGQGLDPSRPARVLAKSLQAAGIPVLDTSPVLEAHAGEAPLTFPDDGHLNARGHELVAETIAAWLPALLGPGASE
jgi:hypothetical protein